MNPRERAMVDLLARGREEFGFVALKAEFETEGTRSDELMRLVDLARRARLNLGVKIGGCEAIRDLLEARQIGADYVVAPMIESAYALSKFIVARRRVYAREEWPDTAFLFNVETRSAYEQLPDLLAQARLEGGLDGVVFGRTDFVRSWGLGPEAVESDRITACAVRTASACKGAALGFVLGGAISASALPALQRVKAVHLDRFETRKVIFDTQALESPNVEEGLRAALDFELLWLRNKHEHYGRIAAEDASRIAVLEQRCRGLQA